MKALDRKDVEINNGDYVIVYQDDKRSLGKVVDATPNRETVNEHGYWIDIDRGDGIDGIPSYLLEVIKPPAPGIDISGFNKALSDYNKFDLFDRAVLLGWNGSIVYGTNSDLSDRDIIGIIIPPANHYLWTRTLGNKNTLTIIKDDLDIVFYEFKKYLQLLLNSNPNIMSLLWLDPEHYIKKTSISDILIQNRDKFLSKLAYKAFVGYAHAQSQKMTKGLNSKYYSSKRKPVIDRFDYDTKHASHLIRLLVMGIELMKTSELNVNRVNDSQMLIDIKNGLWNLEKVNTYSQKLFKEIESAKDNSRLPDRPDYKFAEEFSVFVLREVVVSGRVL